MRQVALLLMLALAACDDNVAHTAPPMDHFFFPSGLALTAAGNAVAGGNQALLVASANFDLRYDAETGATLLSVDPSPYDVASGTGGSAGRPGGQLVKQGTGTRLGSYTGPVIVADDASCPGRSGALANPQAFLASRFTRRLYRFPVGAAGDIAGCAQAPGDPPCQVKTDSILTDPVALELACRTNGTRKSLFLGYLNSPEKESFGAGTAWLTEYNLADLGAAPRTFPLSAGPIGDMAYDATTDRLYAVGRFAGLKAPLFIVSLADCAYDPNDTNTPPACPAPRTQVVDLYPWLAGGELVGIALSNPQPGRPRLAYIAARLYDETFALVTGYRPGYDVGGALLVVELTEGIGGEPGGLVRQVLPLGTGPGPVRVLPVRPGQGDVVVVPSTADGTLQVYDGEVEALVRVITLDPSTGAPEAGRHPSAMAVADRGADALVYVAAFSDWTVSILKVPLASPASADLLRKPRTDGKPLPGPPIRIGSYLP